MKNKPEITTLSDGGKCWSQSFDEFRCKVYVPTNELPDHVVNYGFQAPYLMVFEENEMTMEDAIAYANQKGLTSIANEYATSVAFIYPTCEGGWEKAGKNLFAAVIHESRISQYYTDGLALMWNRFDHCWGDYYIRGAVLRTCIFATGKSADWAALNCLQTIEGDGLYGPGDITPVSVLLEKLSVTPVVTRSDIAVISIDNTVEINSYLRENVDYVLYYDFGVLSVDGLKQEMDVLMYQGHEEEYTETLTEEYYLIYQNYIKNFRRMMGHFEHEADLSELGMTREELVYHVNTAKDNRGDDKDTLSHDIGVVTYYNNDLFKADSKVPMLFCFHGGGDSAMCMSNLSGWYKVAHDYNFLLVSIENHLNSTATEMMELLEKLQDKYPIDLERVYSTGFSMGGCKTWDMYQEYPEKFAAVAPMDATFDVGLNSYGEKVEKINQDVLLPVFYAGGEVTPLPELPFQEEKCLNRMKYVLEVNKADTVYDVKFDEQDKWENKIFGIDGDIVIKSVNKERDNSVLTMNLFMTGDKCYNIFSVVGGQGHEVRHHTCEKAWKFMSNFRRLADGSIVGNAIMED